MRSRRAPNAAVSATPVMILMAVATLSVCTVADAATGSSLRELALAARLAPLDAETRQAWGEQLRSAARDLTQPAGRVTPRSWQRHDVGSGWDGLAWPTAGEGHLSGARGGETLRLMLSVSPLAATALSDRHVVDLPPPGL